MLFCDTIKPVLVVTYIKHPPVFKGHYFVIPGVHFNCRLICIEQPPAFKGHVSYPLEWLLNTGFTVFCNAIKVGSSRLVGRTPAVNADSFGFKPLAGILGPKFCPPLF